MTTTKRSGPPAGAISAGTARDLVLQQQPARPELADDAPAALPLPLHPSGTA